MTVTRRIRSPGRARNKPLKPLRAGMPGDPGEPSVTTLVCFTSPFAREAAGALGTRHSPRPLWADGFVHNPGAHAAGMRSCVSIRHCEEHLRRSNPFFLCGSMDCVVASLLP